MGTQTRPAVRGRYVDTMTRPKADISEALANLVEHKPPESVKRIAAFRAAQWERNAERAEAREFPEVAAYSRDRASQWRAVAES